MPLYIARRTETASLFTGWRTPQKGMKIRLQVTSNSQPDVL